MPNASRFAAGLAVVAAMKIRTLIIGGREGAPAALLLDMKMPRLGENGLP